MQAEVLKNYESARKFYVNRRVLKISQDYTLEVLDLSICY